MELTKCLLIFTIWSEAALAYDWVACKKEILSERPYLWTGGTTLGSSGFTSSLGGCSALRTREDTKKAFLSENLEMIRIESSRGEGDYLYSYIFLYGCHKEDRKLFTKLIQDNFSEIYGNSLEKEDKEVYEKIEKIFKENSVLISKCKV